ncbi:hypothetical protein YC2023_081356 [Brassica napus]
MNFGRKQSSMERVELPQLHMHPLIPFTHFAFKGCQVCSPYVSEFNVNTYGGYRCNELGCEEAVFHKYCANPLKEINHSFHPDHPLKLIIPTFPLYDSQRHKCFCGARHKHSLKLVCEPNVENPWKSCKACGINVYLEVHNYIFHECEEFVIHLDCVDFFPEAYHTSHPQHPLKSLGGEVLDYADKKCLLCEMKFDRYHHKLHHRLIDFTCNACGTQGNRNPYFCLPCNFMIHRECIDLPRVININRHDHRISYTPRLGHGEWKCRVFRKKVEGFYGAYSCSKCATFAVHARCATRTGVWDMVEREGTPEEEEIVP